MFPICNLEFKLTLVLPEGFLASNQFRGEDGLRDELTGVSQKIDEWEEFAPFAQHARMHRDIIKRFGRFPHRNAILDRTSTPDEVEFLTEPNSAF